MNAIMKTVSVSDMDGLSAQARQALRQRANFNLHSDLSDPVQRFLNAVEPGSYVRPHRHLTPEKWELFVILSGAAVVLVLDQRGQVLERLLLDAEGTCRAAEIPAGAWHTLVSIRPGTVLFEFKQGPYAALSDEDFADWAPSEGSPAIPAFLERVANAQPGDLLV